VANDITEHFKEHGVGGFVREELARLRTFGEAALEVEENANAFSETARVDGIFQFAQDVSGHIIRSTLLRLEPTSALAGDD
jgi:hypothetical protein